MSSYIKWIKIKFRLKSCIQNKKYPQSASGCASQGESALAESSPQPHRNRHVILTGWWGCWGDDSRQGCSGNENSQCPGSAFQPGFFIGEEPEREKRMRDGRRSLHRDLKSFFTRTNGVGECIPGRRTVNAKAMSSDSAQLVWGATKEPV